MIKYNEAQSIRKTYDQIVKRLKEERVNFDNQLGAIEATLQAKEHDYEELLLMSHDASHAKDVARTELTKLQALTEEERKAREKELDERRNAVTAREEMHSRMVEREKARLEIIQEAKGDLSQEAEEMLKKNLVTNALQHKLNLNVMEGESQVSSAYEAAFRKIKEATGVGDVNEVIQKFVTQKDTEKNLTYMTKEAQARIQQLADERATMKHQVDEMKYSGTGGQSSRQEVEECEKRLADVLSVQDRVKTRHTRSTKVFVDIRAGIEHMSEKLDPVKLDQPAIPVSDDTIVDVMYQLDSKLIKMYSIVGDILEDESPPASPDPDSPGRSRGSTRNSTRQPGAGADAAESTSYNVRIALEEVDDPYDDEDDVEIEGVEPAVMGREEMKKHADMMLDKATSKGKKKKKATGKFATEEKTSGKGEAGTRANIA